MVDNPVTIDRKGQLVNIPGHDLRQGDLVVVQAGELVPADLRLVEARALEVDEFEITGEILPVVKQLSDQEIRLYRGSRITRGSAKGEVVSTGENTELGAVYAQDQEPQPPAWPRFFYGKYLILVGLLIPAFILHLIQSNDLLAVSAFYGLTAGFLIFLQNGAMFDFWVTSQEQKNLRRLNIQIQNQRALDGFNHIDIFCFDKTGVLTGREMSIRNLYFADQVVDAKQGFDALDQRVAQAVKRICALCNDVLFVEKLGTANPIDKALISFSQHKGIHLSELMETHQRIYDEPFDSENRYMACGYQTNPQEAVYFAKGDPGVILRMCKRYLAVDGSEQKIDFNFWSASNANVDAISQEGDTAIALAYAKGSPDVVPAEYIYVCLLQLGNTLQPGVREVIRGLDAKKIRSMMLTGDRADTAVRISLASGISQKSNVYLTGPTIDRMGFGEVARQAAYVSVLARLIPSQKGALIRLLQQNGHTLAMVGDGTNDGLALKVADVGISFVRDSSPIARRLADILITDLTDILTLLAGARNRQTRSRQLKITRMCLMVAIFLGIYGWLTITGQLFTFFR